MTSAELRPRGTPLRSFQGLRGGAEWQKIHKLYSIALYPNSIFQEQNVLKLITFEIKLFYQYLSKMLPDFSYSLKIVGRNNKNIELRAIRSYAVIQTEVSSCVKQFVTKLSN